MNKQFPRTDVAGVSLSRIIIGTNWLLGWSHKSVPADNMIRNRYSTYESFLPVLSAYAEYGIDTIMGPISQMPLMVDALKYAEDKLGRGFIIVDTPVMNTAGTPEARKEAQNSVKASAAIGSKLCLVHHSSVEKLVNKGAEKIERIGEYTDMIRSNGLIPGLSAHMPEIIVYSDKNGYDVETYIQIYNCMGFLMQVEIETVAAIINNAKKPVMTIKSMAAGRCTPYVGLNFSWNTIRPCDMVTLGAFNADEVHEDVEISFAALEHRFPIIGKRSSPNRKQAAFGDV